jgi:4-hydroxy-tetrahydrodipicolinate synthase
MTPQTLKGTWSTILLPLDERNEIIWKHVDEQLSLFAEAGVDGIYFNGTAGEFFSQSEEEFLKLASTVSNFCDEQGIPFQIGASHAHASGSLQRIRQTHDLKPGAFQVILPEWIPHTDEEIAAFLIRMAAEAAPIPLVVYNPPNARKVLSPQEWFELVSTVEGIIGIKVAGGDESCTKQ